MLDPSEIHGKLLALIAWGKNPDGSDNVAVFAGIATWDGSHLSMQYEDSPPFVFYDEWLTRIKPVADELREPLLDADYCLSLTIGHLPEGEDASTYIKTGMHWPDPPPPRT